jgi:GT2 family glycosyltransferase
MLPRINYLELNQGISKTAKSNERDKLLFRNHAAVILRQFPSVSIIILNYNCKKLLFACLRSIMNMHYTNFQVVLVDNNSTDGSAEFILKSFNDKRLKIIKLNENYGFSVGNNIGVSYTNSDYIVFLNPDTKVDPDCLTYMMSSLECDSSIGVAQPKLIQMTNNLIDSTGGFIDKYGFVYSRGLNEQDYGQYDKDRLIFYAKGAALAIRRDLWNKLGGFDPIFFTYYEETDLCWRAQEHGYKVAYIPEAIVYHVGGASLAKAQYRLKYNEAKGRLILLLKHYSIKEIIRYVPITLFLHLLNVFRQLSRNNGMAAKAIILGTLWGFLNFRQIWKSNNYRRTFSAKKRSYIFARFFPLAKAI